MSSVKESEHSMYRLQKDIVDLKIKPENALELLLKNAFIIILNVPAKTEFGLDYMTWTIGTKFCGIKMVPAGLHLISTRAFSETQYRFGVKHTTLVQVKAQEILVFEYDKNKECIIQTNDMKQIERVSVACKRMELDAELAIYPFNKYESWIELTNRISSKTWKRINTNTQGVYVFLSLKEYEKSLSVSQRQRLYMDKTTLVSFAVKKLGQDELLAELQLSFVLFLIGESYDALEAWKVLLDILCTSEEASSSFPDMFKEFFEVLQKQMKHVPTDFFLDPLSERNFIQETLVSLYELLFDSELFGETIEKLKSLMFDRFLIDISINEDGPIIVE